MNDGVAPEPDQPESLHQTPPPAGTPLGEPLGTAGTGDRNSAGPRSYGQSSYGQSGFSGTSFGPGTKDGTRNGPSGWSEQAADLVVETVDKVRIATTDRIIKAAKAVVYGVTIGLLLLLVVPLVLILVFRVVDVYLPGDVWSTYLLFGLVFVVAGSIMWGKRKPQSSPVRH